MAACSVSLSLTKSLSKLMSIESEMPCNHLILCHSSLLLPSIFPSIMGKYFPSNESLFTWGDQIIGVLASTSVLPMNTQDWAPLGWTGWISLQPKGLSRVFSNTTFQKYQFYAQLYSSTFTSIVDYWNSQQRSSSDTCDHHQQVGAEQGGIGCTA